MLQNKNIGIVFIGNFYIKENLINELNKISKIENVNITLIFKKTNNKIIENNIYKIKYITPNKLIFYSDNELHCLFDKKFDILILIGFTTELLNKLNKNIFDNFILNLIKCYEKEKIPIILGLKCNFDIFSLFKQIEFTHNKKYYYFIPILFPNPITKPKAIVFDSSLIIKTIEKALDNIQIEPFISHNYI